MNLLLVLPLLFVQSETETPTLADEARALAEEYVAAERAMGISVGVIAPDGEVTYFGVGRLSETNSQVPDERTLFEIGSVSKVLTGVLLADAVDRGELTLTDTVQSFLPDEVQLKEHRKGPIRLVHLTTHSSGLPRMPENFNVSDLADTWRDYGDEELYAFLGEFKPKRAPGIRYAYSNLGVGLLGHLLGRQIGSSYEDLLVERLCVPLGMKDTSVRLSEAAQARFAPGHDAALDEAPAWDMGVLAPCGGIRSCVVDLLRFLGANLSGDSSIDDSLVLARKVHSEHRGSQAPVGLGWHVAGDGSTRLHSGQTAGYHSYLAVNTELRVGIVVLANTATGEIDALGNSLVNLALGVKLPGPGFPPVLALEPEQLERFVGRFAAPSQFALELTRKGRKLYALVDGAGQSKFRILPVSESRFEYVGLKAAIEFEKDEAGTVTGLVFKQNGIEYRCEPESE